MVVWEAQAALGDGVHLSLRVCALLKFDLRVCLCVCVCACESATKMTDRGMRAVADLVARHTSLEELHVDGEACTVRISMMCGTWGQVQQCDSGGVMLAVSVWMSCLQRTKASPTQDGRQCRRACAVTPTPPLSS